MIERVRFAILMGVGATALMLATAGEVRVETAPATDDGHWTYECTCVAHGSKADHGSAASRNAKPDNPGNGKGNGGGGGGGGKKEKDCAKTFGAWGGSSISVFVSDAGRPATVAAGTLASYVDLALDEWSCYSGLGETVTLTTATSAAAADISVGWGNLGATGILGRTSVSLSGGTILDADVVMNSNQAAFTWTAGPAPVTDADGCLVEQNDTNDTWYDFLSVTIHEVGHAFGIDHPTKRCNSRDACYPETMFACTGPGEFSRRATNAGDQKAIAENYGADQ